MKSKKQKNESTYGCIVDRRKVSELLEMDVFWVLWETLPSLYEQNFFVSKTFVINWLKSMPGDKLVVTSLMINSKDGLCAIGLFFETVDKIKRVMKLKTLNLLRTGDDKLDKVWPEYLMPRCKVEHEFNVGDWLQETLNEIDADCVKISSTPVAWGKVWVEKASIRTRAFSYNETKGYCRTLPFTDVSPSVRRNVSQTERYSKSELFGDLNLKLSTDHNESLRLLSEEHKKKWDDSDTKSGFNDSEFNEVLSSLLLGKSGVRIYDAYSGDVWVGSTLILTSDKWAGFYVSGYKKFPTNKWHIGIWMHCKVMEVLSKIGFNQYDFMAGDENYKKRLSNNELDFSDLLVLNSEKWVNGLKAPLIPPLLSGNIIK